MISYGRQNIISSDISAVVKCLRSDFLTQGPAVVKFEKALAKYCGAKYAVAVGNGTAGLHLAYLAAGLKKGDEVITSPNTFVATTNMLLAVQGKPIFGEIRPDTYNLDEKNLEKLITKKTKAIVPVHFAGQPAELKMISRLAKKHKLMVIEDACHALGAVYQNSRIGACKYSVMAIFSFHPVKSITTGEGGAILTNNGSLYKKLLLLRNHGVYKNQAGKNLMVDLGYNYRLTDLQASLGLSQLKRLKQFMAKRRQVVGWYKKALGEIKQIILPQEIKGNKSTWHLYVILIKNSKLRDRLAAYLKSKGIGVNFHYPAVYSHPYYKKLGYKNIKLFNEEVYHNSCITLPCHTLLTPKDINYIAREIKIFFNNKK